MSFAFWEDESCWVRCPYCDSSTEWMMLVFLRFSTVLSLTMQVKEGLGLLSGRVFLQRRPIPVSIDRPRALGNSYAPRQTLHCHRGRRRPSHSRFSQ